MKTPYVVLTTALSALALAGAVGVGVAAADPTADPSASPSPTASSTPAAGPSTPDAKPGQAQKADKARKKKDLTARALHGKVTLGGKKTRVVDFQRGTVSAVGQGSLTVRSTDGFVGTYVVGSKTHVRVAKKDATIADVATGDRVRVTAVRDGQTLTPTRVVEHQR